MYETALIADDTITSNEDVISDSLSEDLDLEDICDDFFGFTVNVWMDEGDIIVACNHVSEGR